MSAHTDPITVRRTGVAWCVHEGDRFLYGSADPYLTDDQNRAKAEEYATRRRMERAAPDLLAALNRLLDGFSPEAVAQANLAIAKAEGRNHG